MELDYGGGLRGQQTTPSHTGIPLRNGVSAVPVPLIGDRPAHLGSRDVDTGPSWRRPWMLFSVFLGARGNIDRALTAKPTGDCINYQGKSLKSFMAIKENAL